MEKNGEISTIVILQIIADHPKGATLTDIRQALVPEPHIRKLQRLLKDMLDRSIITTSGKTKARKYHLSGSALQIAEQEPQSAGDDTLIPLSPKALQVRKKVTAALQKRKPVGYSSEFLERYRPNKDAYLTLQEQAKLAAIGQAPGDQAAGTYARQILNRILIDLSWNSSRLEGNTYSLLDTERLIQKGETNDTRSAMEAQMILNHKDAIEFMVETAAEIGFNSYTIRNLHAMLANNLLSDPEAPGRLRTIPVGISGSVYTPLAIPQLINQTFELILEKASEINDPFEQSFFIMVHLPYLQPFDDVNKRVSRLTANIPFIKNNFSPLSFTDVPNDIYTQGMLGVYEFNDVSLLKDVFIWGYERSAARYAVVRQSLGEPNPFRLKYRNEIKETISTVIREIMNSKMATEQISLQAKELPGEDQTPFIEAVETELLALHDGNFARYRVSPKEFQRWKDNW